MKIHTRGLMLAAIQLPLAGFIAEMAKAESPQQMERLEALVRAQAAQIEHLSLEMKALKKAQSKISQRAATAPQQAEKKVESKTSQQAQAPQRAQTAPQQAKLAPLGPPVAYTVAYIVSPPGAKTPGAMGSPQYPNYAAFSVCFGPVNEGTIA